MPANYPIGGALLQGRPTRCPQITRSWTPYYRGAPRCAPQISRSGTPYYKGAPRGARKLPDRGRPTTGAPHEVPANYPIGGALLATSSTINLGPRYAYSRRGRDSRRSRRSRQQKKWRERRAGTGTPPHGQFAQFPPALTRLDAN